MKKLFTIIAFALCFVAANATHLTNGSMYYEYLNTETNGDYRYKITLVLVRDCAASQVGFDDNIKLGLYQKNVSDYKLVNTLSINKTSEVAIINNGIYIPLQGSNLCFREAKYETEVILKSGINDYIIVHARCCRNTLNNVVDDNGNTFFVKINTASQLLNSSPVLYNEAPIALSSSAKYFGSLKNYDRDGDSCSYHLVDANIGGSANDPIVVPPQNINLPFTKISYRTNYTAQEPLGKSPAYFNLNSATGNFTAFPKSVGRYLLAYEVKEWRNGQLIGTHYREMLLLVISIHPQFLNTIALKADVPFNLVKKIRLNWGHNIQQTDSGYILERRTDSNPTWQPIAKLDSTVYNYTDTLIGFDTLYFYRVMGYNSTTAVYSNDDSAIVRKNTVGIHNPIDTNSVRVYPNPATDKLYFDIRGREIPQSIIIYTLQGKHIKTMILDAHVINSGIDISVLPSGIYYIQIQTQQGVQTQKILKQ